MSRDQLFSALADIFGFSQFRPHQEEIVSALISGRDVFAVMPTGGGKSLCYQLPACLKPGVAVVVSPLISLMKDQVDAANANGIGAASLNSAMGETEKKDVYRAVRQGHVKLLYISPERFNAPGFTDYLKTIDLSFFAVDEAHCISEWGHDFRPDYLSLSAMIRDFPGIPVAAFTATATPRVAEDIVVRLGLRNPHLTRASFNRPNLTYRIAGKEDVDRQVLEFVRERGDEPGIIYRTTRKTVEATAAMLAKNGVNARAYHAGLADSQRHDAQDAFRHDRCQVVVATIAFGMGIDKPNVRFVVHADLPKNLEGYYQETGRAGRDGEPAQCLLLYGPGDMAQLMRFNAGIEDETARTAAEEQLRRMIGFARADGCRRAAILSYFGEDYPDDNCGGCDICLDEVEREDATESAQKALSAMARTGGRFGAMHLADILVGADTEKIRQNGHDRLPTHGVGKDRDKTYWRRVIEALVGKGLAEVADARYPTPAVTEKGWLVLRGEANFEMLKEAAKTKAARRGSSGPAVAYSKNLFAKLRKERARLAEEKGLPPYMVFSDRALQDMARLYPETPEEMLAVSGVGSHKLKTYGDLFMQAIGDYLREHPEERRSAEGRAGQRPAAPAARSKKTVSRGKTGASEEGGLSETEKATWDLLSRGLGIAEAAEERGLAENTIVTHMERLAAAGMRLRSEQFLAPERLNMIQSLFASAKTSLIKPVVELSNGEVTYLEARIARIFVQAVS